MLLATKPGSGSGYFKVRDMAGDLIRERRGDAGLSQAQLGALVGVSQNTISKLERGDAAIELVMNVAAVMGITLDHVIEWVPRK